MKNLGVAYSMKKMNKKKMSKGGEVAAGIKEQVAPMVEEILKRKNIEGDPVLSYPLSEESPKLAHGGNVPEPTNSTVEIDPGALVQDLLDRRKQHMAEGGMAGMEKGAGFNPDRSKRPVDYNKKIGDKIASVLGLAEGGEVPDDIEDDSDEMEDMSESGDDFLSQNSEPMEEEHTIIDGEGRRKKSLQGIMSQLHQGHFGKKA